MSALDWFAPKCSICAERRLWPFTKSLYLNLERACSYQCVSRRIESNLARDFDTQRAS